MDGTDFGVGLGRETAIELGGDLDFLEFSNRGPPRPDTGEEGERPGFVEGEPQRMTTAERTRLESRGLLGEVRLSCQILCFHDMQIEVINRESVSGLGDAGPRPADHITPLPTWIPKP